MLALVLGPAGQAFSESQPADAPSNGADAAVSLLSSACGSGVRKCTPHKQDL